MKFDENWIITDNGKNIDYFKVNGGFIGLLLKEGNHNLEMKFEISEWKVALPLTIAGVFIFLIYCCFDIYYKKILITYQK